MVTTRGQRRRMQDSQNNSHIVRTCKRIRINAELRNANDTTEQDQLHAPCIQKCQSMGKISQAVQTPIPSTSVMHSSEGFHVPTIQSAVRERIQTDSKHFLLNECRDNQACICCDEGLSKSKSCSVPLSESLIMRFRRRLFWRPDSILAQRETYNCANVDARLDDIALSHRGIFRHDDILYARLCEECFNSLNNGDVGARKPPPKFSIANGFAQTFLPQHLADATWAEIRLVTIAPICGLIKVIGREKNSNGQCASVRQQLCSHQIALIGAPGPIVNRLPRSALTEQDIMVMFSQVSPEERDGVLHKWLRVRPNVVRMLMEFLQSNSIAYRDVENLSCEDCSTIESDSYIFDELVQDNIDESILKGAQNDMDRVGIANCSTSSIGLFHRSTEENLFAKDKYELRRFQVRNSNILLNERDSHYFGKTCVRLFPHGVGTPYSPRCVHVPLDEAVGHLIRLSTRQFAQDAIFPLLTFNMITKLKANRALNVKMHTEPDVALETLHLTPKAYEELIKYQHSSRKAALCGLPNITPPQNLECNRARRVLHAI